MSSYMYKTLKLNQCNIFDLIPGMTVIRGKRKKFCPFHDKNLYMHGISVQYLFLYGSVHYLPTDIKYMYMRLV